MHHTRHTRHHIIKSSRNILHYQVDYFSDTINKLIIIFITIIIIFIFLLINKLIIKLQKKFEK